MWIADRIEKLVPYLRRYARAATGETELGDQCVERVLQSVLTQSLESGFEADRYDRERLYTLLDDELNQLRPDPNAKARRALLLIAVEGFSEAITCRILGVKADDLPDMLEVAEKDFAESTATRMLIIEDEPLISAQLKRLTEGLGHKVIGIASTAQKAVEMNQAHQADIILCDIMLADGSLGTDAIAEMQLPSSVPVVYITAYPEKYLSTSNEGPSYLITKPFSQDYLKAVIGHALLNVQND